MLNGHKLRSILSFRRNLVTSCQDAADERPWRKLKTINTSFFANN